MPSSAESAILCAPLQSMAHASCPVAWLQVFVEKVLVSGTLGAGLAFPADTWVYVEKDFMFGS